MAMDFLHSETQRNLMRAFAGESQARNRYLFSAGISKKSNLHVIESVFLVTADQERAHAKVFYDLLAPASGQNIRVDGAYPVDIFPDVLEHLKAARHNETQEHEVEYAGFAKTAREEGFEDIAKTFERIAGIEKTHAERFDRFIQLMEQGKLFVSDVETQWVCLNCGMVVSAAQAPQLCPVCKHPQGYFIRLELSPFA